MQYLLYILAIPFLYLNYRIIVSDIKHKIIPNKYLMYLLFLVPIYYIYIFFSFPDINYLLFIGQIALTLIISFILYSFGIWSAGDAKYLLVLSLFIPYIGIIPFIGNLALLTIGYLLLYFLWFYFGKCLFIKGYAKGLGNQIKTDLKEKWLVYKGNKGGKTFFILLKWIVIFLILFVSIRLARIYLFNNFFESLENINLLSNIIEKYHFYLIFGLIILFIGGLYLFKYLINITKLFISSKLRLNINLVGNILLVILFISLSGFILYEYTINSSEISKLLFLIFTIYISIYLIFKILVYSYKLTFSTSEYYFINIKDLKEGDIVDKDYLIKMFGEQVILGNKSSNIRKKNRKKLLLYPKPSEYISKISNPIDKENKSLIKKIFIITNNYNKNKKTKNNYKENKQIKILKTFSFAPYILIGFIITYIFGNEIINGIIKIFINILKELTYIS